MPSRKERQRAKRRVEKQLGEAWEALARGEPHLARKIAERALNDGAVNPRVWVEVGEIQQTLGEDGVAEKTFLGAYHLAPTYRPALSNLVNLYERQGLMREALTFQERLLELDPQDAASQERAAALRAAFDALRDRSNERPIALELAPPGERLGALDRDALAATLFERGACRLEAFVEGRDLDAFLAHAHAQRRGSPEGIASDAHHLIAHLERERSLRLGSPDTVLSVRQLDVRELARDPCEHAAPEPWPNAHRLGPLGMLLLVRGVGTFVQEDRGMSRPRRLELPVRRGDAIVFEVRDRLVTIGGAIGLQPVVQGFAVMEAPFVGVVFA